jgi:choline dehydrogenase-like flavoprotein
MAGTNDHYDVIFIGSGPGMLARRLAATGRRILMLECGDYLHAPAPTVIPRPCLSTAPIRGPSLGTVRGA